MRSPHVVFVLNVILGLGRSNDQVVFREVDELGYTSWIGRGYKRLATKKPGYHGFALSSQESRLNPVISSTLET